MSNFLKIIYVIVFGGAIGFFAKSSLVALSPVFLIFTRIVLALLFFTVILLFQKKIKRTIKAVLVNWQLLLILAVSGVGLGMVTSFIGLNRTTVINYSLLFNATPLAMILFSAWLLKEKIRIPDIVLLLVALAGSLLIITQGKLSIGLFSKDAFWGDILVFAGAGCWGFYSVYGPAITKKRPEIKGLPLLYGTFLVAVIVMSPFVVKMGLADIATLVKVAEINLFVIASTLALSVFSTAILFLLWLNLVIEEGGVLGSFVFVAEDVVGVLLPIAFLGEILTIPTIIGGAMIILPLVLKKLFFGKK